jgi:hypothetical protein
VIHRAKVVDTNDPSGRTRVRVSAAMYGDGVSGWIDIAAASARPLIGDIGFIALEDADITKPVWVGPLNVRGVVDSYAAFEVSGGVTVDFSIASVQKLTLGAVESLEFTGFTAGVACGLTLYLEQDASGGRTMPWPSSVLWPGGEAPELSTAGGSIDIVVMETFDGGASLFANLAGLAYA